MSSPGTTTALPAQPAAQPSHYEQLGGAAGVAQLVESFYRQMDSRPDAAVTRALHAPDLSHTKTVLRLYLSEWLGGPKEYSAQRGHPRLRMRHGAFAIGVAERDAWLACMRAALAQSLASAELQHALMQAFFKTADWMRNTDTEPTPSPLFTTTKDAS